MKLKNLVVSVAAALASTGALAGDFVELAKPTPPSTIAPLTVGATNPNADKLYIQATSISFTDASELIPSEIVYNAIATTGGIPRPVTGSGTLTLLASRTTEDVVLAGEEIGNVYDFVFRDSRDSKLVFGTRVMLGVEPDQSQDSELNFLYRHGFDGYSAAAAWTFVTDFDLRMYNAGRTNSNSLTGAIPFDPDAIRFQSDVNLSEGNPYSGLFLIKTDAEAYKVGDGAIGLFQAGEEGQPRVGVDIAGFVPTAPIPEPSTYAMLLGGLGLLGVIARRRRV